MKTRDVYLLNQQTLNDTDTVTVDLTKSLKILYLLVQYSNLNGATSNTLGKLNGAVSKLSVIDGSNVLHSLSMQEEQAKNAYDYGQLPFQQLSQVGGATVVERAVIDFRRYQGDRTFYLDTSRYQNPQLQFSHSFPISATAGFQSGNGKLTVIARVIDSGAEAQQGFVMAKELDSFASSSSGDHITDLPLDFPIAAVMVLDPVNGSAPDAFLSNFKLTADTDSFIPINEGYTDLIRRMVTEYGKFEQTMVGLSGTSWTLNFDLYSGVDAWAAEDGGQISPFVSSVTANQVVAGIPAYYPTGAAANTATTATTPTFIARGATPQGAVVYRFGDGVTPQDIFSPQGVGKLQLKLTNTATGATPKVVTIQQHS